MKKNNAILLSTPYIIWMVVFTLIPLGVVCYYALTDPATGAFTLDNLKNLGTYAASPVICACGGSYMVTADLIENGKWDEITRLCKESVEIVKEARKK